MGLDGDSFFELEGFASEDLGEVGGDVEGGDRDVGEMDALVDDVLGLEAELGDLAREDVAIACVDLYGEFFD